MELRGIEQGMVVHCQTEEEARALMEWAYKCGYEWMDGKPKEYTAFDAFEKYTCYHFNEARKISYAEKAYFEKYRREEVIEYSDLVLPELTAAETLDAFKEICAGHSCRNGGCILYGVCPAHTQSWYNGYSASLVIAIIQRWIAARGKKESGKELQTETVNVCRIIEILPDGGRRCVHEAEIDQQTAFFGGERLAAEKILETYRMCHEGEFIAVHETVSRVKKE